MRKLFTTLIALFIGASALVAAPPSVVEADYIRNAVCNWQSHTSVSASGYCPHRTVYYGPQYFRIRVQCFSPYVGSVVRYGPWRSGGNWTASTVNCVAPYSFLSQGQTWIQFYYI